MKQKIFVPVPIAERRPPKIGQNYAFTRKDELFPFPGKWMGDAIMFLRHRYEVDTVDAWLEEREVETATSGWDRKLPTYEESHEAVLNNTATALQKFVYHNEPFGDENDLSDAVFRQQLYAVLMEVSGAFVPNDSHKEITQQLNVDKS